MLKVKKEISFFLVLTLTISFFTYSSSSVSAEIGPFDFSDDFSSSKYTVGGTLTTDIWSMVANPNGNATVKCEYETGDSGNKVGRIGGTTYAALRTPSVNLAYPTVLSGRVKLSGKELKIGVAGDKAIILYFTAAGAVYAAKSFSQSTPTSSTTTTYQSVGNFVLDKWINFTICVRTATDPSQSTLSVFLSSADGLKDTSNNVVQNIAYTGLLNLDAISNFIQLTQTNTTAGKTVDIDDIHFYNTQTLDISVESAANVGSSVRLKFSNPIKKGDLTADKITIAPYDNGITGTPVTLSTIVPAGTELWPVNSAAGNSWVTGVDITPSTAFSPNTVYKMSIGASVPDFVGNKAANAVLFSTGAEAPNPGTLPTDSYVEGITITPDQLPLSVNFGLNATLKYTVSPTTATQKAVKWYSTMPSVATVDEDTGNITPISVGTAGITAKSTDGTNIVSNQCTVTVSAARAENQKLNVTNEERPDINISDALQWPASVGDASVALWKGNATGAFSVTVDDSIKSEFSMWMELSQRYGIKPTFFNITSVLGDYDISGMVAAGMDMQSHTKTHENDETKYKNILTSGEVIEELAQPIRFLNQKPGVKVKTFAYPPMISYLNHTAFNTTDYVRKYYIAARDVTGNINMPNKTGIKGQQQTVDYGRVSSQSMSNDSLLLLSDVVANDWSLEGLIKSLYDGKSTYKNQVNTGGWGVIHNHYINGITPVTNPADATLLGQKLDYAFKNFLKPAMDSGKIWNGSFTDVAMYAQERDTNTLTVTENSSGAIRFTLTDLMDDTMFNYPLTVRVCVDNSWDTIKAVQNGVDVPVAVITDNAKKYILLDVVPDKGEVTIAPVDGMGISPIVCEPNAEDSSAIDVSFTIQNNTGEIYNQPSKIYLAAYAADSNILEGIKVIDFSTPIAVNGTASLSETFTGMESESYRIKAMLWNNEIQPVTKPSEVLYKPQKSQITVNISPSDDIYSQYNKTDGWYGVLDNVIAQTDSGEQGSTRFGYLKFNLSALPEGVTIKKAELCFHVKETRIGINVNSGDVQMFVYPVANDTWTESGTGLLLWTNQPAMGATALATLTITGLGNSSADITNYLKSEYESDKIASLGIKAEMGKYVQFWSDEATDESLRPYLKLTYEQ